MPKLTVARGNLKYIAFSVLFLFASLHFVRTTFGIAKNNRRLQTIHSEVAQLEKELEIAKSELAYQQTDAFIEEQARNKLNLVKPNEQIFVLNQDLEADFAQKVMGLKISQEGEATEPEKSNLKQWFDLIL